MATVMSPENEPKTFSDLNNDRQDGRHPRLVVQIPAQDEAQYIGAVIGEIPHRIVGIAEILVIVINDGSIDDTAAIAKQAGADYVLHHVSNRGLAAAYRTGLDAALRLGADIVVNLDADGQYDPKDIPRLIQPILAGKADVVVGDRRPSDLQHFSPLKRWLQAIGSWTVRRISGSEVPDAASGFRALSREAALRTNVLTDYTYTLETIIQAGAERTAISSVTVSTRPTKRKSRLVRGIWSYVQLSMLTLLRTYTMYSPLKVFITAGALIGLVGLLGILRFLYFAATGDSAGHVQSLVISGALLVLGFQVGMIGLLADLIAANRRLLQDVLYRLRRLDGGGAGPQSRIGPESTGGDQNPPPDR